eukprot:66432_1
MSDSECSQAATSSVKEEKLLFGSVQPSSLLSTPDDLDENVVKLPILSSEPSYEYPNPPARRTTHSQLRNDIFKLLSNWLIKYFDFYDHNVEPAAYKFFGRMCCPPETRDAFINSKEFHEAFGRAEGKSVSTQFLKLAVVTVGERYFHWPYEYVQAVHKARSQFGAKFAVFGIHPKSAPDGSGTLAGITHCRHEKPTFRKHPHLGSSRNRFLSEIGELDSRRTRRRRPTPPCYLPKKDFPDWKEITLPVPASQMNGPVGGSSPDRSPEPPLAQTRTRNTRANPQYSGLADAMSAMLPPPGAVGFESQRNESAIPAIVPSGSHLGRLNLVLNPSGALTAPLPNLFHPDGGVPALGDPPFLNGLKPPPPPPPPAKLDNVSAPSVSSRNSMSNGAGITSDSDLCGRGIIFETCSIPSLGYMSVTLYHPLCQRASFLTCVRIREPDTLVIEGQALTQQAPTGSCIMRKFAERHRLPVFCSSNSREDAGGFRREFQLEGIIASDPDLRIIRTPERPFHTEIHVIGRPKYVPNIEDQAPAAGVSQSSSGNAEPSSSSSSSSSSSVKPANSGQMHVLEDVIQKLSAFRSSCEFTPAISRLSLRSSSSRSAKRARFADSVSDGGSDREDADQEDLD